MTGPPARLQQEQDASQVGSYTEDRARKPAASAPLAALASPVCRASPLVRACRSGAIIAATGNVVSASYPPALRGVSQNERGGPVGFCDAALRQSLGGI